MEYVLILYIVAMHACRGFYDVMHVKLFSLMVDNPAAPVYGILSPASYDAHKYVVEALRAPLQT